MLKSLKLQRSCKTRSNSEKLPALHTAHRCTALRSPQHCRCLYTTKLHICESILPMNR